MSAIVIWTPNLIEAKYLKIFPDVDNISSPIYFRALRLKGSITSTKIYSQIVDCKRAVEVDILAPHLAGLIGLHLANQELA